MDTIWILNLQREINICLHFFNGEDIGDLLLFLMKLASTSGTFYSGDGRIKKSSGAGCSSQSSGKDRQSANFWRTNLNFDVKNRSKSWGF